MALKIVAGTVAVVLLCLALAWSYPGFRMMARRSQVSYVILSAELLRREIDRRALEKGSLAGAGKGLSVSPSGPVTGGSVSDDGVILLRGSVDGYAVEVGFKPSLKGASVEWRCRGLKVVEGWFIPESGYFPRECPKAASLDAE